MKTLIARALSVRQPWAWLIVNGFKDIENRTWPTRYRGPVLIHSSKGMSLEEYEAAYFSAKMNGIIIPSREKLERGGIVGSVEITDCVGASSSPWFHGPNGFVLANAKKLPFRPLRGALGFFKVECPAEYLTEVE